MAFCVSCGKEVEAGGKFCHHCGTPAVTSGGSEAATAPDPYKTVVKNAPVYGVVNLEQLHEGHLVDDRYEVRGKLGQGGFGAVYRVFDQKMECEKALKVLPEAVASDLEAMENIRREAVTMAKLNHPNIVRIFEFQDKGAIKYIDMEFVDGMSLTELKLKTPNKKLREEDVTRFAKGIADGLAYAHKKGVIHRDIKPPNILVNTEGEPKITDFGIAETVKSSMSRIANSGSSGTLVYMSPEQIRGKNVGRESDIYSFGVVLYELLTGTPPFSRGDISYQVLNEAPEPMDGVSENISQVVMRCLEKDYQARYRGFEAVTAALAGESILLPEQPMPLEEKPILKKAVSADGIKPDKKKGYVDRWVIGILVFFLVIAVIGANMPDKKEVKVSQSPGRAAAVNETKLPETAQLYVSTTPTDAVVRILNIKPRFFPGMALDPGRYHLSVSRAGYETKKEWITLTTGQEYTAEVVLERTAPKGPAGKISNSLGMQFVYIKPGTFEMGSPSGESGRDDDEIRHRVTLSKGYYLQTTEVTQGQWKEVMGNNPSVFSSCGGNCPVESMAWWEAQSFIQKLNAREGGDYYRLPTEAEWEVACRAGSQTPYANGKSLLSLGWSEDNSGKKTHPVAQKTSNDWGLYDMHGNVLEWCQDWYADYPSGNATDPVGSSSGSYRVLRGGSWRYSARACRSANREYCIPNVGYGFIGLRLARTP